jgi:hypothetical protein
MAITQNLTAQIDRDDATGQVTRNALALAATDVRFVMDCDHDFVMDVPFQDFNCDSIVFLQEATTLYRSRWWTFAG